MPDVPDPGTMGESCDDALCFSVIVPLYNKRDYIRRTVWSALTQQWECFELIVVDDGSTDGSMECISDLADSRLRIIAQPNSGPGAARNLGVAHARHNWIAFLDADDIWYPDHLSELSRIIRTFPEAALVSAAQIHVADESRPLQPGRSGEVKAIDYFSYAGRFPFGTSATAARRETFDWAGGFGNFRPGQDTEMWARIMLRRDAAISTRVTSLYVKETGGISDTATHSRKQRRFADDGPTPLNRLLSDALRDPQLTAKHPAIRMYLDDRALGGVRKAVVEGDILRARRILATVENKRMLSYQRYRMLVATPAIITQGLLALRNRFRNGLARP